MSTKRERLDRATKNAYRKNRRAGWKAARERALRYCQIVWGSEFLTAGPVRK